MAEPTIQQALQIAVQHHQAGQLQQAEILYRQILAQQPNHADALHLLGLIAHQIGRHDLAVDLIGRAIAIQPAYPDAHVNLGSALKSSGQLDEAIVAYRQAIALQPSLPAAHNNLGIALADKGQLDEAIAAYSRAIALNPNFPDAHINLGNALQAKGKFTEAIACFGRAVALNPQGAEAFYNLGNALQANGQLDEAIAAFRQTIALKPSFPEAFFNLGNTLKDKGQFDEAIANYRQALALNPNFAKVYNNLGNALRVRGQLDEAIASHRQAVALEPNHAESHANLGAVLADTGQANEALAAYRQAIALKPDNAWINSNLLYTLHYAPDGDAQVIAEEHRRWNRLHAEPLRSSIQPHHNDRTPDRRLRIGYVSPDLREHPVGRFLLPLLANHDKSRFDLSAYAQVPAPDELTRRLRSYTDGWRSIVGLSDAQVADLIRQDRIDILVDLAGHTASGRLLLFARKPAPVQVTYLGYPNTTGLSTMDYRLTDAYADPPGQTEQYYSEQLVRLTPCAWCYEPSACPPITERRDGPITFGCFNTLAKVTDPMLRLWSEILRAVPESRLLVKAAGLNSERARQRVRELLDQEGIEPSRIELRGYEVDRDEHLALYGAMDIALDTFPYHGTTTTCEALWMGVPVVTLAGPTHVSRVGVSLLSNVGLPELVAQDPDNYVRIAATLVADMPRLAELRRNLRQRMQQSPLMDAPRFARAVETAFGQLWQTWCAKVPALR